VGKKEEAAEKSAKNCLGEKILRKSKGGKRRKKGSQKRKKKAGEEADPERVEGAMRVKERGSMCGKILKGRADDVKTGKTSKQKSHGAREISI